MKNEGAYNLINIGIRKLIENALKERSAVRSEKIEVKESKTDYVTTKELMEILNLSESTISRYRKAGMPHIRKMGKKGIRYDMNKVIKWMEA